MTSLLIYKEKLKAFYGKHDGVIVPLIKFILVFLAALELNIQSVYSCHCGISLLYVALWGK